MPWVVGAKLSWLTRRAEQMIAERLRAIAFGCLPWPAIDTGKAIPWVERRTGLALADSQKQALGLAVACKALVITGTPGVGKTTLVNSILRVPLAGTASLRALLAWPGRGCQSRWLVCDAERLRYVS
jgi:exodeoxyribonuclease V alpha subunit